MAPATNLGAATPVDILNPEPAGSAPAPDGDAGADSAVAPPATAPERKAVNDAAAYIRSLAELRGRNVEWAEAAVRSAASLSSSDALGQNVIDIVAADLPDLLQQLDGRAPVSFVGQRVGPFEKLGHVHGKDIVSGKRGRARSSARGARSPCSRAPSALRRRGGPGPRRSYSVTSDRRG